MRLNLLIFISILMLTSCKTVLTSTFGTYYINHIHNEGIIDEKTFYTEIPYEIDNKRIFINIKLQGSKKEHKFLFDTGAYSSISEDFVNKLDGEVKDYQFSTKDVNGNSVHQSVFCLRNIQLGSLEIKDKNVVVTTYVTNDFNGVVGSDLLKGKIFIFNPNTKMLIITNDNKKIKKKTFDSFPLKKRWDQKHIVKLQLNQKTEKYILDTGYEGFLALNDIDNIDYSKVLSEKKMRTGITAFYSTQAQNIHYLQIKNAKINSIEIESANFMVSSFQSGKLLGCEILHHGVSVLDFIGNKIYLEKDLKIKTIGDPPPMEDVVFGSYKNQIAVAQVSLDLKNINIEPFDILLEINNEKIEPKEYSIDSLKDKALLEINHFILERDGKIIQVELTKKMLGL